MRDENFSIKNKLSWSKTLVRKWFNIKTKAKDVRSDYAVEEVGVQCRTSFSDRDAYKSKKSRTERLPRKNVDRDGRVGNGFDGAYITNTQDYRVFVGTWNVGGRSPSSHLNLEDWLHTSPAADIYVIGFQEIVPLNAGNVLLAEDNGPAKKWVSLVRKTLNNLDQQGSAGVYNYHTPSPAPDPIVELNVDFERSLRRQRNSSFFHRRSFQSLSRSSRIDMMDPHSLVDRRFSVCDRISFGSRPSDVDTSMRCGGSSDDENIDEESPSGIFFSPLCTDSRYCLVASKQMVGIFLMVWVRSDIREHVKNLKVSCVGRGLMGYLGNKGSISISMSLHQTSFCFVCTHLTSGQKDGDQLRRNADVLEILRKTRFPHVHGSGDKKSPETILDHDRIIWLGDLNYRIALSYRSVNALVEMHKWKQLLEKDQLRIEQRYGRVFAGWKEGRIYFPPTYKYSYNSDRYAGDDMHPNEKRRTPAWCDRILWYGRGLNQLCYVRGESRFSDHRPVYSIFTAEVQIPSQTQFSGITRSSSLMGVDELPYPTYPRSYMDINFY
ncbi:type IV inositol polyphosphate 5-phosphatase 7-like isoform X1 [Phragmites australis]|uniref:type IV inositol polyphosphate 5-phosphatase 7-like isoform X1 n=1 Tax=Phragmites australis TaxID=29695 RepID=UPI002D790D1F|nr:type IV inositol polyphosphate 5-phosphatase 7-like isoform X1 [Phragmites australis]